MQRHSHAEDRISDPRLDPRPFLIMGSGGHASSVAALCVAAGFKVAGLVEADARSCEAARPGSLRKFDVLFTDSDLQTVRVTEFHIAMGIGAALGLKERLAILLGLARQGFSFPPIIHPSAVIDSTSHFGMGTQVMAGAIVQPDSELGTGVILNTRAVVEHGCSIGDGAHIAPGTVLCGNVTVGPCAFVGAGSVVRPSASIDGDAFIRMGSLI